MKLTREQVMRGIAQRRGMTTVAVVQTRLQLLDELCKALCVDCRIGYALDHGGDRHVNKGPKGNWSYCEAVRLREAYAAIYPTRRS